MEDKKLTEKESIELITAMISRTKERYIGDGNILLMWGYLVVITAIVVWVLVVATHQNAWNWLWFAIPAIGFPITLKMARKNRERYGAVTYSDKLTAQIWRFFGISEIVLALICLGFNIIGGINCWGAMLIYPLLLAPAAEMVQGLVIKEKCLTWGGMTGLAIGVLTLCCVAGRITLFANWYMPLFILAFVAMMIVPGHILSHKDSKR